MKYIIFIIFAYYDYVNANVCNTHGYSNPEKTKVFDFGGNDESKLILNGLNPILSADIGNVKTGTGTRNKYIFSKVYESEEDCPERCFDLCNFWANDIAQYDRKITEKIRNRQCAGFTYTKLENKYECTFVIGTTLFPPECLTKVFDSDETVYLRIPCDEDVVSVPFSPPLPPSFPPPNVETLILRTEILIPLIIGTVIVLILIVVLFRECTRERADSFNQVFRALFGRKSNRVVIDTNKKVESSQAVRK